MKRLLLLRHGKSDWSGGGVADFDRPLAPRGIKASARIGEFVRTNLSVPEYCLCSSAVRARQTWALVAETLGPDIPVKYLRSLYHGSPSRLLAAMQRAPDDAETLLVIGHNPAMEHLAEQLSGPGSKESALARLRVKYPTAALCVIGFAVTSWASVRPGSGKLQRFVRPKDL